MDEQARYWMSDRHGLIRRPRKRGCSGSRSASFGWTTRSGPSEIGKRTRRKWRCTGRLSDSASNILLTRVPNRA